MTTTSTIDALFHALANETRRAVVSRLTRGPASVSELAAPFDMALPSFHQHLRVLVEAGVVHTHKQGRVRTVSLAPQALEAGEHWLAEQRALWTRRLDQLDAFLQQDEHFQEPP